MTCGLPRTHVAARPPRCRVAWVARQLAPGIENSCSGSAKWMSATATRAARRPPTSPSAMLPPTMNAMTPGRCSCADRLRARGTPAAVRAPRARATRPRWRVRDCGSSRRHAHRQRVHVRVAHARSRPGSAGDERSRALRRVGAMGRGSASARNASAGAATASESAARHPACAMLRAVRDVTAPARSLADDGPGDGRRAVAPAWTVDRCTHRTRSAVPPCSTAGPDPVHSSPPAHLAPRGASCTSCSPKACTPARAIRAWRRPVHRLRMRHGSC